MTITREQIEKVNVNVSPVNTVKVNENATVPNPPKEAEQKRRRNLHRTSVDYLFCWKLA